MAEHDPYPSELDLAAAFRSYLVDAPTQVAPTELARHFASTYPHRRPLLGRWGFGLTPAMARLLLATGLLLALVAGSLVAGALRPDATGEPAAIEVLPAGPIQYTRLMQTRLVATSGDELWAISDGRVVWHFRDGAWTSEEIDASRVVGPNAGPFEENRVALAPDGTVWAAGKGGVAYRRDGRWVVVDTHASTTVAVDREGTVWVAGTESPCDIWSLRPSGSIWTRTSAGCPRTFGGGVLTMAIDGRGALWVGAAGFVVNALARYVDGRWESSEARAGLPRDGSVYVLGVSATGDVWIEFQVASTGTHARARFDGTTWTVGSGAANMAMAVAVAPDGAMWASALARYDWEVLAESSPSVVPPLTPLVVAPDGTVFAVDGDENLVRLAAASPSP